MGKLLGWIGGLFKVADDSAVERTMFDADGYLYQRGTKLTQTAAQLNGTGMDLTSPNLIFGQASHSYGTGHTDWTLSATEQKASTLICTGTADAGCAIVAPAIAGRRYTVNNNTGQAVTIKKTGGTGVAVANTKTAIVEYIGSDYVRLTADA